MTSQHAFDVCGPLPTGVTVLEASAGTGKTFTIAALATRYVADGTPLDQLLLVTFTRMATGELRDRVRERLVSAEQGLARALAGVQPPATDTVLRWLADGPADLLERRRSRLADAVSDFDAATIATIHGFCQHMLAGLGTAGDVERDVVFVDDVRDLVREVVDDLYLRRFAGHPETPLFGHAEAVKVGFLAVGSPDVVFRPTGDGADAAAMRVRLAEAVRNEVEARKRRAGIITYDDLLTRLRATLADPERGPAACARLRQRYRVALVDEFQDTDPVQWEILRRTFADGDATLVLIGDPKQAIYGFRGADVFAYLEAARQARSGATLDVNWRSDQGLLNAFDALFADAALGHPGIPYRRVRAAPAHRDTGVPGAVVPTPLRIRVVRRRDLPLDTRQRTAPPDPARERIADDVASDLVRLLSSPAQVSVRRPDGSEQRVTVEPGHVAILVRKHKEAALIRRALARVGIPAVIAGAGSVFGTEAATQWLRLLQALERPTSPARARAAALTPFVGWSAARIADDDTDWEQLHARLHQWADVLSRRGVASLQETITLSEGLPQRLLSRETGERRLTDLRHVGELLHAAALGERLGPAALVTWLRERVRDAGTGTEAEERARRLESDAAAVQVLTIHRSKGLEFPIVYCPFLWDPSWIPDDAFPDYHDPASGRRTIDLTGAGGPPRRLHVTEQRAEDLRLAYVALTRAKHQAVLWWAGTANSRHGALSRLLLDREHDGTVPAFGSPTPADDEVVATLERLASAAPGCISVETADPGVSGSYASGAATAADLDVERFVRTLDRRWRRTSYSGITAHRQGPRVGSEPETALVDDEEIAAAAPEPTDSAPVSPEETALRTVPSPLADMPGGAEVGTFVHRVLEHTDFAAADLDAELTAAVTDQRRWSAVDVGPSSVLVAGLRTAIETPLGPVAGGRALRGIARRDRVDELAFELPLVGGDDTVTGVVLTVDAIAGALRRHLPADHLLAGYADRLADPVVRGELRGYLAGSLDLVFRVPSEGDGHRYAVVDYKTNWLGQDGQPLSAWHYRPRALTDAMERSHYPLQALLYSVALHRYLRWRLPGYDPERNFAGVLYLFLRGMSGPGAAEVGGHRTGVFSWRPPSQLLIELSDVFDRGATR